MSSQSIQRALEDHFNAIDAARRRLAEEDTVRISKQQEARRRFVAYVAKEVRPALQATAQSLQNRGVPARLTESLDLSTETTPVSIRLDFGHHPSDAAKDAPDFFLEAKLADTGLVRITYTQREGNIHPVRSSDHRQLDAPEGQTLQDLILDCVKSCFPVPTR